jgi:hypothetical protein
MGFGDFFIAATVGAMLATCPRRQRAAALLAAVFCLCFDLLFLVVNELPTTVPIALSLAVLEVYDHRRATRGARMAPPNGRPRATFVSGQS